MIEIKNKKHTWRLFAGGAIVLSAAAIAGQSVLASLNATAFNTVAENVQAGTMELTLDKSTGSAGFTSPISNLAPGDTVNRYVTLTNSGSLAGRDLKLSVSNAGATSSVITDATKGLQLAVLSCATPWTIATGTCSGGAGAIEIAEKAIGSWSVSNLASAIMAAGDVKYLKFSLKLPDQNETTQNGVAPSPSIQNAAVNLTYTFDLAQRAAETNLNS